MLRDFFNTIFSESFYVILLTAVVCILGLVSFFNIDAIIVLSILTLFFIILIWKNLISPKLVFFWIAIFLLSFFNAYTNIKPADDLSAISPQDNATIKGQVLTIPDTGLKRRTRFFFQVTEINDGSKIYNIKGKTFVNIEEIEQNINIGDFYELTGKLRTPTTVSNPSQFDYARYLKNYRTHTTFYADSLKQINGELTLKWKLLQKLNDKRKEILSYHGQYVKSPNIEILGGVVFGDDAVSPPDDIKQDFINSGILHILAASGMNVALIYGIFFYIFSKIRIPYKISNTLGIFIVILYTLMTGMGPSVIRAAIILIFILVGKLIDREADNIPLLGLVAFIMLFINPAYINDVGFQLSFIVTFGLITMCDPIFDFFKDKMPNWLTSTIFIPIIAQIWVAPIQMFYFNTFSLYSILTNIIILPFITIISFGGFISSVLATIKPIANSVCFIFDLVLNPVLSALVQISNFFAHLPHALINIAQPTIAQIWLYYLAIFLLTVMLRTEFSKKKVISFITLCIFLCITFIKFPTSSELIFFDVQNADCILYKTHSNKYFIIDTGKSGYNGHKSQVNYILLEYLKDKGIKNIEGLILTHFDADHAGGAEDLIKTLKINNVYVNSLNDKSNIAQTIYKLKPNLHKAQNNQIIYKDKDCEIKTYIANFTDEKQENENSIITEINDDNYKSLLIGDAGFIAYEKVKDNITKPIDVFKVGHHGAKNVVTKSMMEELKPKYSIISTGQNRYGHPNKVTLSMLYPSKILRTDRNNAIMVKNHQAYIFNGKKWILTKFLNN